MKNSNKQGTIWKHHDHEMMSRALQLARLGEFTARPNPMVGCVIEKNGQVIGQGWHQKFGGPHAEVHALNEAGEQAKGSRCYVTLEPCAHHGKTGPCANALIEAGVAEVIAAMQDPNPLVGGKGFALLEAAGIKVSHGLMEDAAQRLNRGFVSRIERGRPWITCKLAMSLDGRTALADGKSQWITGKAARADVQKLRAKQDAIITGTGTLLNDNPSLTVRESDVKGEWFKLALQHGFSQPMRVLIDRQARATGQEKIFVNDAKVIWVTQKDDVETSDEAGSRLLPANVSHWQGENSLSDCMQRLAEENCGRVLIEAGHTLVGGFLKAELVDELIVYMAPKLMGTSAMGLIDIQVNDMALAPNLELKDVRMVGDDIRLTYGVFK